MGLFDKLIKDGTPLKSVPYGKDRRDGGSSNQPYMTKPIPDELPLNTRDIAGLRGGILNPLYVGEDVGRLGKFFSDFSSPASLIFNANQNILSRIGPATQQSQIPGQSSTINGLVNGGIYLPTSTLLQIPFGDLGGHLLKQGLNPFPQSREQSLSTTLLAGQLVTYSNIVPEIKEKNRLVKFYNTTYQNGNFILDSYGGGAGSQSGIGRTTIYRYNYTNFYDNNKTVLNLSPNEYFNANSQWRTSLSNTTYSYYDKGVKTDINYSSGGNPNYSHIINAGYLVISTPEVKDKLYQGTTVQVVLDQSAQPSNNNAEGQYYTNTSNLSKDTIQTYNKATVKDFRTNIITNNPAVQTTDNKILSKGLDYTTRNIETRVHLGDPGKSKNVFNYAFTPDEDGDNTRGVPVSKDALDKINALPVYNTTRADFKGYKNDLVKFRIGVFDTNSNNISYIHFRAFIENFNDGYSNSWEAIKYAGRADKLYKYGEFERNVSLDWTVVAQSKAELIPMYKKLNYLASALAPRYNEAGYMFGNLMTLTVGGYLYDVPGIVNGGLNYNTIQEGTWEIGIGNSTGTSDGREFEDGSVKELPHIIKVSGFKFTPIHEFLPRTITSTDKNNPSQFESRFISLANGPDPKYTNYK